MNSRLNSMSMRHPYAILLIASAILCVLMPGNLLAAEGGTLWGELKKGGLVMFGLLLPLSVVTVGLLLECVFRVRKSKASPKTVVDLLQKAIADGNYQEAWRVCDKNSCFLTNVLKPAIQRVGRGKEVVREILSEHGLKEAMVLRARLSYLSMVGVIAPMFGLLGTVTGMIGAFRAIAEAGALADPTRLSAAISEALVNTAMGLFLACPGFIGFYIFRNRIQEIVVDVEDTINLLVEDIPFEQLQGIKIGPQLEAELASGTAPAGAGTGAAAASAAAGMPTPAPAAGAVIVPCPNCNAQIPQGIPNCPNCKAQLEWA